MNTWLFVFLEKINKNRKNMEDKKVFYIIPKYKEFSKKSEKNYYGSVMSLLTDLGTFNDRYQYRIKSLSKINDKYFQYLYFQLHDLVSNIFDLKLFTTSPASIKRVYYGISRMHTIDDPKFIELEEKCNEMNIRVESILYLFHDLSYSVDDGNNNIFEDFSIISALIRYFNFGSKDTYEFVKSLICSNLENINYVSNNQCTLVKGQTFMKDEEYLTNRKYIQAIVSIDEKSLNSTNKKHKKKIDKKSEELKGKLDNIYQLNKDAYKYIFTSEMDIEKGKVLLHDLGFSDDVIDEIIQIAQVKKYRVVKEETPIIKNDIYKIKQRQIKPKEISKKELKQRLSELYHEDSVEKYFDFKNMDEVFGILKDLNMPDKKATEVFCGLVRSAISNNAYIDYLIRMVEYLNQTNRYKGKFTSKLQTMYEYRQLYEIVDEEAKEEIRKELSFLYNDFEGVFFDGDSVEEIVQYKMKRIDENE